MEENDVFTEENPDVEDGFIKKIENEASKEILAEQNLDAEGQFEVPQAKPDAAAVQFLQNIDPAILNLCIFDEKLTNTTPEGDSVGEFKASVEKTVLNKEEVLLVQASTTAKVEDTPMKTVITAYLNSKDLSVLKQEHLEVVKIPGHELEKKTLMELSQDTGQLVVNRQITQGGLIRKSGVKIPKERLKGFVTEGSNIIVERLMTKTCEENDVFNFITVDTDSARLVSTQYSCLSSRKQQIGSKELEVYGIERKLQSISDVPHTWQSYFMDDGHLTMRVQVGSPLVMLLEKVPRQIEPEVFEPKPVFEKQPLIWEEDMEMQSRFLMRKEELKAGHQTYLRDHPEVSALLADFFQFVLLRKPDDVVSFASEFFSSFSNTLPDVSPYSHSKTTLIPATQSSKTPPTAAEPTENETT